MSELIYLELVELKDWWFDNPNIWFNSNKSDDIHILNKYEYLTTKLYDENLLLENKEYGIGYIILFDQITRHIARANNYSNEYIQNNLLKIIKFVKQFYSKYKNNLEGNYFCFILLPLRHLNKFEEQTFVMNETWKKITNISSISSIDSEKLIAIYKKYLKATYERSTNGIIYLNENTQFDIDINDILDKKCLEYDKYSKEIVEKDNIIITKLEKVCEKLKVSDKKYILSISGGVDSMILANLLKDLSIDFVLVHINYANRNEISEKEKILLSHWSHINKIPLYIRDIYEINRPKCMKFDLRNMYEDYTKKVRYSTYLDVAKIKGWDNEDYYVLLGHNYDDCIENILTNISNKTKYDNLKGMEYYSKIKFCNNTINFIRPFLSIPKIDIYNYAEIKKINYLIDSTPKWSQRGIIRDIVKPTLINWNKSSLEGLDELSNVMRESLECVDILVSNWLKKMQSLNIINISKYIEISVLLKKLNKENFNVLELDIYEIKINKIFWSIFLEKIGFKQSCKSLNQLLNKINKIKTSFDSIQIKQLSQIQISKDNKIYWWKKNSDSLIFIFE